MSTLNLACAHCGTINRIPTERLNDKPNCGRCKKPVITYAPTSVTEKTFANHVLKSDVPVVVDFWATWCGPCVQFSPVFQQAAASWEPRVRFVKVDADSAPELSARYGIRSIPSLLLFHQGKEIGRQAGAMPGQMFDQWLETRVKNLSA